MTHKKNELQPLGITFQSFDTPADGVTMDLGEVAVTDPLAMLHDLVTSGLSPYRVWPSGGTAAGRECVIEKVDLEERTADLRTSDGALHCYTADALFGRSSARSREEGEP